MNERNFGEITAFDDDGEWRYEIFGTIELREGSMEQLEDSIRSARLWVRDQKRRQAENDTPELPMQ